MVIAIKKWVFCQTEHAYYIGGLMTHKWQLMCTESVVFRLHLRVTTRTKVATSTALSFGRHYVTLVTDMFTSC